MRFVFSLQMGVAIQQGDKQLDTTGLLLAGAVKEEQMAPSTPSQPGVLAVEDPAQQLWSAGLANATDVMLQLLIPDLWPQDLQRPRAPAPVSAGSEASAESAIPEGGELAREL